MMDRHWVGIRRETSGASKATLAVAEASEATNSCIHLHKASTTARPYIHTPLTLHAYSYYPPKQANTKAALIDHHYGNLHFLHHAHVRFNHFNHALWVEVRCEASEATPAVAEASRSYL